jgi:ribulose 1,5-bisphosphate synthetase/thiazole synthase
MTEENTIPQGYWDNSRWAREHSTELHERYKDVWVAIADKQVVVVGADPVSIRKIAARKTGRSTAEIAVKFIESGVTIYGKSWALF